MECYAILSNLCRSTCTDIIECSWVLLGKKVKDSEKKMCVQFHSWKNNKPVK